MIVGAAVLPVGPATERFRPFRVDFSSNSCGPAVYVAFHRSNTDCGTAATKRLQASTPIGLLVLALGMAMFAGDAERHHSRVVVGNGAVRRRGRRRSPGNRRYMPG